MDAIPRPQVLDADRPLRKRGPQLEEDDRPDLDVLERAFKQTCDYANTMWTQLEAVRSYLMTSLPAPGTDATPGAPGQPADHEAWQRWVTVYGDVVSVLCGPDGDSGFGHQEAVTAAERRGAS